MSENIFERHQKIILIFLFLLFLAVSIPGIDWGTPALWNPDELVWRANMALGGEMVFDETEPDFNYPSLPKYVMLAAGKFVFALGYSESTFIISARLISALLGALGAVLVYYLTRAVGGKPFTATLAGLLYITSETVPTNARFAHNDLYVMFFSILCVFSAVQYQLTKSRAWLYGSFLAVGMAASSKYTGASLLLVPLFTMIVLNWVEVKKDLLHSLETLALSAVLTFAGFAIGTPKALLWMAYYFKRAIPAALNFANYGANSGTPIGLYGQWAIFKEAVGAFGYYIFIAGAIWFTAKIILQKTGKSQLDTKAAQTLPILLWTILIFDLPFLISINYIPRHFIPFVPFLAVLGALLIADIFALLRWKQLKYAALAVLFLGFSYSFLRLTSSALLFANDARMPATEYIATLDGKDKRIEYTLYPPNVIKKQFATATNYPIYFVKYPGEQAPTGGRIEYNVGEAGLLDRNVEYLVIDSLTYARLYNPAICETNPVECDFFISLLEGNVTTYKLIKDFSYRLPPFLPQLSIAAVNPDVKIYQRVR